MNVADVLEKAADLIEVRGHAKDKYEDDDGHLCAVAACNVALGVRPPWGMPLGSQNEVYRYWHKWVASHYRTGAILWNDLPEVTAAQVIDALKLAAKDWRNAQ